MSLVDARTTRVLFTVLLFALAFGFFYVAHNTLIAFLFAIFFAYLIDPAVSHLEKWTKGRGSAIAINNGNGAATSFGPLFQMRNGGINQISEKDREQKSDESIVCDIEKAKRQGKQQHRKQDPRCPCINKRHRSAISRQRTPPTTARRQSLTISVPVSTSSIRMSLNCWLTHSDQSPLSLFKSILLSFCCTP